jgi:DHA1 family tetracycline resistance protein-like MFS transporter
VLSRRRTIILFLIVFVNFLGGTIMLPTLPLYAERHFGASPETISLLLASFFGAQFLAAPILGRLSDKHGRLPVLIFSQIGTVLSFVILGAAQSLPILFAGRILDGITGGNVIVAQAYITDITPPEKRAQGLGIIFAGFGLGYMVGPALGGLVGAAFDDRAPFYVGAAVSLLTVILTWLMLDESLTAEKRLARAAQKQVRMDAQTLIANRPLVLILLIAFCAQFSIALMQATIALFGEAVLFAGRTARDVNLGVGLLLTGIGVGQFATQLVLLRPIVARFGERRMVVFGAVLRGLGMLSLTVFTSPWLVGSVSLVTVAVASGIMMPALQALTTTTVPEKYSGGVLGIYQSSASLGIIVGTALGGLLFSTSPTLPFAVAGAVLVLTAVPAMLMAQRTHDLKVKTA